MHIFLFALSSLCKLCKRVGTITEVPFNVIVLVCIYCICVLKLMNVFCLCISANIYHIHNLQISEPLPTVAIIVCQRRIGVQSTSNFNVPSCLPCLYSNKAHFRMSHHLILGRYWSEKRSRVSADKHEPSMSWLGNIWYLCPKDALNVTSTYLYVSLRFFSSRWGYLVEPLVIRLEWRSPWSRPRGPEYNHHTLLYIIYISAAKQ